ncbi:MAG TPA: DNA double-strand break repair nuclease NurA, partial [Phormidium sp.]
MLDLTKIARQMQGLSEHLAAETVASRQRLEIAQKLMVEANARQEELLEIQEKWRERLIFSVPVPVESLDSCVEIPIPPKLHTVIATDGSQISPSHHEIAYCYLINIGRVVIHYGQGRYPLLDSLPEVFYRPEDLYISRQWGIRVEEWMGYRRTVSEAIVLGELVTSWVQSQREGETSPPNSLSVYGEGGQEGEKEEVKPLKVPTLAMVDGSLIYWFLEGLPGDACDRILPPILEAWEQMRLAGVPLLGYISASRSTESLNLLRLQACPHPSPNCVVNCGDSEDKKTPCQVFDTLRDTPFWISILQPGQRTPLWKSTIRILNLYGENHEIYFCYVHVGSEIARVEFPAWVAENSTLLNQALSLMLAQIQKGYGYPISLSEAHNQAVIKGEDRARFFAFLEQQMIKAGLKNVGIS